MLVDGAVDPNNQDGGQLRRTTASVESMSKYLRPYEDAQLKADNESINLALAEEYLKTYGNGNE